MRKRRSASGGEPVPDPPSDDRLPHAEYPERLEDESRREFESAQRRRDAFDPDQWERALKEKRAMAPPPEPKRDPGVDAARRLRKRDVGMFLPEGRQRASVRAADNPNERASFGFVGACVEVVSRASYLPGTLIVRLDKEAVGPIVPETIRLFRWDEQAGFRKLERSGLGEDGSYAWGEIAAPGIYAAIGLHSDPLVLQAIKTFCGFGNFLLAADPRERKRLQDRICQLILCAPQLRESLDDEQLRTALLQGVFEGLPLTPPEEPPGGWPPVEGPPGDICERCLGLDLTRPLPECELLPVGLRPTPCVDTGWRDVGPADLAGCILQVVVDPTDSNRLYAAAADGGVWRLDSVAAYPGSTWIPIADQEDTLAIAAMAVAPSNGQVVYVADALGYLLRSNNRGASWTTTSGTKLGYARKVIVHPSDEDTVFVASSTGFWGSGDGGQTWTNLNAGDITDAAMDPDDASIFYVGKRNVGVEKTFNSGLTWRAALPWSAATAPTWTMIKIALGARGTDANRTVAAKFHEEVFLNRRGGRPYGVVGPTGWQSKGTLAFMGQWDWDHVVAVDPFDDNVILVGGQVLYRTTSGGDPPAGGGQAWAQVASFYDPHEDQQSVAFDPANRGVVYLANDGGIWRSTDGGATWHSGNRANDIAARRNLNAGLVTAQFYRVGVTGNRAVGNLYHSGIIATDNLVGRGWQEIEGHAWEFSYIYADARRPSYFYVFHGALGRRRFPGTGTSDFILGFGNFTPPGGAAVGGVAADPRLPSQTVVSGAGSPGRVMRTLDANPDAPAWGAVPGISLSGEPIVSLAFAPSVPGKAYAASASGRVFRKDDVSDDVTAPSWTAAGQWSSPTGSEVRQLAVNGQHDNRIYLVTAKEVVRSHTGGAGPWNSITGAGPGSLPASDFHSIVAHADGRTLFVAADIGVFISRNDGATWHPFDQDLPNAIIGQIFWSDGYLYAVTYGRGLWRRRPCL